MPDNKQDLVVIPYHDWRKVEREGGRTRDAHLISHLARLDEVGRVVIINRPISPVEMFYKRQSWKSAGAVVSEDGSVRITSPGDKLYLIDYLDRSIIGPLTRRKMWFLKAYGSEPFVQAVRHCLKKIGVVDYSLVSFNLFAVDLFLSLDVNRKAFDGWDNFLRFPEHGSHKAELQRAYRQYFASADLCSTNSQSNRSFYEENLGADDCLVIGNGVDKDRFAKEYNTPADLRDIPRPIIGVGAKVTHLLDTDLLNHIVGDYPDFSFVLIGQMLNKAVFERIKKAANFYYLGDKHYDQYPAYVSSFDVCLIPYVVGQGEHGGDSIKFYEYLAANKQVVATAIEGITTDYGNTFIAQSYNQFSDMVGRAVNADVSPISLPDHVTWSYKARTLWRSLHETVRQS